MSLSDCQRQTLLAYLGAVPFVVTALLMSMGIGNPPLKRCHASVENFVCYRQEIFYENSTIYG
jgi:hypothetical protein